MYFKFTGCEPRVRISNHPKKSLVAVGFLWLQLFSCNAAAETPLASLETELLIKPNRCVALREGQDCYQELTIRWQSKAVGDYCLVQGDDKTELRCWKESDEGVFDYDFHSDKSTLFLLLQMPGGDLIASAEITVAWVYKTRRRKRLNWRLF